MEEMEKRSDRHIRDLVAHTAFKGLAANEIGCARISMMAGSKTLPSKGRIQMRQTNYLQIVIFDLQRTAGPYRCAKGRHRASHRGQAPGQSWPIALRIGPEASPLAATSSGCRANQPFTAATILALRSAFVPSPFLGRQ